ncbi:IS21-like element helper ATPase IstB [Aquimarina muelleri]|uniref:IS21-like element helper ATPase IstB n=1 Tax=Aquimarina muelleri TaxID=279356 RepID=UPI003F686793
MELTQDNDKQITWYSKELRLPTFRRDFKEIAIEAAKSNQDYETFLLTLMEKEYLTRLENRKKSQIRQAGFPSKMYLNDLQRELLPKDAIEKLPQLERLDFIDSGQNIVLAGNPGTGKTHIAVGLGLKACMKGYKVLFTSIHRLLTQIRESHSARTLRQLELRFEKYDLVICDEFGYVSFDKEGAELLFNHLSLRAGRKATIVTTNLGFDRWEEIFGDPVLTAALVDRLTHKAHLINMNGESYRLKETKEMNKIK